MRELLPLFTGLGVFVALWFSLRAIAWVVRTIAAWRASDQRDVRRRSLYDDGML